MGCNLLRRSSVYRMDIGRPAPTDPDPKTFKIETIEMVGNYTIAVITYPNCTNFEGRKVLVYAGDAIEKLNNARELDPHFLNSGLSPIARFQPTEQGISMARALCGL